MIRRAGNFGVITADNGAIYSFNLNAKSQGWMPSSRMIAGGSLSRGIDYVAVNGVKVIPYGFDNDLPGRVQHLLSNFYAGEGIMYKKIGLQWGEGPRLYADAVDDASNMYFRRWMIDPDVTEALDRFDYSRQMLRCLVDLVHLEGFWVKITLTRGRRISAGKIAKIEHIPASKVRFKYPDSDDAAPTRAVVGAFPNPDRRYQYEYPIFDPANPLKHPVSVAYYSIYSYNNDHYSVPRYVGAFDWIALAGTLANILAAYNENASAISMHIESPQSYWDKAEANIKQVCEQTGEPYNNQMLEDFKDEAMEAFAASLTGKRNAGKYMHTSVYFNAEAGKFEGWKVTPIDKKIKDYIEAQVAICRKAEAAATSGFGLDPALSNLILDTKLGSGSEKLYSLKVYNATETAMPDRVLCAPFDAFIKTNFPGKNLHIGLYRGVVEAEKNVSPQNRLRENA